MSRPNPWRTLRSKRGLRNVLATGAAASASATLGALATDPDSEWYARIEKPSWQPPPVAFPLVWTPLYADIAATSAAALTVLESEGRTEEAVALRRELAVNLVLNTGWSVLFWRARRPWLATAWCGALAVHSAALTRRCESASPGLGAALAPYPLWCGFATTLNAAIARRNT